MDESLIQLIEKIPALPTLPSIAERILSMVNTDETSTNEIVETIEQDPAISSKVIGVANTALYRTGNPVTSVKDAVMRVGFNTVRSIALSIALLTIFKPSGAEQQKRYHNLFRHSVTVGIIARDLRLRLKWSTGENAFTAGLLHDLGLLALNVYAAGLFDKLTEGAKRGSYMDSLEQRILGVSHGEIGFLIAERWHLPPELCDAIKNHHQPAKSVRFKMMTSLVHVSDAIASRTGYPPLPTGAVESPIAPEALAALGIKEAVIQDVETMVRNLPIVNLSTLA